MHRLTITVIIEICSWLPPFSKQNLLLFIQPITVMFCFNEFAFTVQVKHKITQILGFILICLYFTTGHFYTCKECGLFPF